MECHLLEYEDEEYLKVSRAHGRGLLGPFLQIKFCFFSSFQWLDAMANLEVEAHINHAFNMGERMTGAERVSTILGLDKRARTNIQVWDCKFWVSMRPDSEDGEIDFVKLLSSRY